MWLTINNQHLFRHRMEFYYENFQTFPYEYWIKNRPARETYEIMYRYLNRDRHRPRYTWLDAHYITDFLKIFFDIQRNRLDHQVMVCRDTNNNITSLDEIVDLFFNESEIYYV